MDTMKASAQQFQSDHYKVIIGLINLAFVVHTNPEMGKEIATKGAKLYKKTTQTKRTFVELFNGSNIFAEDDPMVWSHQRHLIEPSFAPESLRMVSCVTEETLRNDMFPYLNENLKRRDVMSEFAKLTMDVIGKAGFSYRFDSFHSREDTLEQKTNFFMQYVDALRILPTRFLRKHFKVGLYAKLHDSVESFQHVIMDIIRKRELEESSLENRAEKEDKSDVLSLLLRDRKVSKRVAEEVSRMMSWFLMRLSCLWQDMRRLHETFDYEDFHSGRLDNIKAVFRETLRLYPVAIGIVRELVKNIEWHKKTIPKGTLLVYSWVLSMMSEEHWEDPESFKPTRFLKMDSKSKDDPTLGEIYNPQSNPFIYTPFGIGGRICIGKSFAEVEGVITEFYVQDSVLQTFKSIVKQGDVYVESAYHQLMKSILPMKNSTRRYLALIFIHECMRSKTFREISHAVEEKALEHIEQWSEVYGDVYPSFKKGHDYVEKVLKFQFPKLREHRLDTARIEAERKRHTQIILMQKFKKIRDEEFDEQYIHIEVCLRQLDACLNQIVPTFENMMKDALLQEEKAEEEVKNNRQDTIVLQHVNDDSTVTLDADHSSSSSAVATIFEMENTSSHTTTMESVSRQVFLLEEYDQYEEEEEDHNPENNEENEWEEVMIEKNDNQSDEMDMIFSSAEEMMRDVGIFSNDYEIMIDLKDIFKDNETVDNEALFEICKENLHALKNLSSSNQRMDANNDKC
ncbi:hypothetical protein FDP41_005688 [Naegleria fowleri]|uniref:Cytochrome P450 n=1 Tax=Naegleria fowleri TaxID=5763 RepID=A0A6A5BP07_NAEFO|nr:uncharacterized protein FDP41_005688 [Naegleria fowleri]KAF0975275.1 hypothetical protein FDP41_005688 [Naegleria fowleri]